MIVSMLWTVNWDFGLLESYFDPASVMIVFGGSIGELLWGMPINRVIAGFKAVAFSMMLRAAERSLTDAEANAVRDAVAAALLAAFPGARMR